MTYSRLPNLSLLHLLDLTHIIVQHMMNRVQLSPTQTFTKSLGFLTNGSFGRDVGSQLNTRYSGKAGLLSTIDGIGSKTLKAVMSLSQSMSREFHSEMPAFLQKSPYEVKSALRTSFSIHFKFYFLTN